jgi:hypothetical protein
VASRGPAAQRRRGADAAERQQRRRHPTMDVRDVLEKVKPLVLGFVCGVVVATIVGFGTGWVVTAGTQEKAVWTAKVNRVGVICAAQAAERWQAQGQALAELRGWDRWEQRERLAEEVTVALRLEDSVQSDVSAACRRLLEG